MEELRHEWAPSRSYCVYISQSDKNLDVLVGVMWSVKDLFTWTHTHIHSHIYTWSLCVPDVSDLKSSWILRGHSTASKQSPPPPHSVGRPPSRQLTLIDCSGVRSLRSLCVRARRAGNKGPNLPRAAAWDGSYWVVAFLVLADPDGKIWEVDRISAELYQIRQLDSTWEKCVSRHSCVAI